MIPTLADIAGVQAPDGSDGISFLPELTGNEQPEHRYLYWEYPEYGGQQAVRINNWKGIRKDIKKGNLNIELYNLENDIQEQIDVAEEHPEIVREMEAIMVKEHETAVLDRFKIEALGDKIDSEN